MENNKTICKVCRQLKDRILIGKFDKINKKYKDNDGKIWNGKVCGTCHLIRTKQNMKNLRSKKVE